MCLRGGNTLWGNTERSHDVCTAEISKYGSGNKLKNVNTCNAFNLTTNEVNGGLWQQY